MLLIYSAKCGCSVEILASMNLSGQSYVVITKLIGHNQEITDEHKKRIELVANELLWRRKDKIHDYLLSHSQRLVKILAKTKRLEDVGN